jgi:uncharacterized integral membrane protein
VTNPPEPNASRIAAPSASITPASPDSSGKVQPLDPSLGSDSERISEADLDHHGGHTALRHGSMRVRTGIVAAVGMGILVTIFSAQNLAPVRLNLLVWTLDKPPLFVVCLACVAIGIAIGILFSLTRWPRRGTTTSPSAGRRPPRGRRWPFSHESSTGH